eukprot:scaffold5816_cov267-Pinguiococcus_pyrenoidosus.AAC.17
MSSAESLFGITCASHDPASIVYVGADVGEPDAVQRVVFGLSLELYGPLSTSVWQSAAEFRFQQAEQGAQRSVSSSQSLWKTRSSCGAQWLPAGGHRGPLRGQQPRAAARRRARGGAGLRRQLPESASLGPRGGGGAGDGRL